LPASVSRALAADENGHPPIGTWPAGVQGKEVFIGVAVPRTGTYAEQGEDELKGWQLAVEHLNSGHSLIKEISPKTKKGVQARS
jgi:ABC-type branched-subunit amino acid transport system substrate-binding protein